jgi:ATP-dependent DNA helicase DinG
MSAAEWLSDSAKGIACTVRPAQVEMATLVEKVLQDKGIAMIEAGTGTGKSFGYLVPAILSGKRVVVSTAKKALQKQLRDEDLPFLLGRLPSKAQFASLKGKSNYVCMMRAREFATGRPPTALTSCRFPAFSQWIAQDNFAELDDFTGEVDFANHVRVNECIGTVCDFYRNCGYQAGQVRGAGRPTS